MDTAEQPFPRVETLQEIKNQLPRSMKCNELGTFIYTYPTGTQRVVKENGQLFHLSPRVEFWEPHYSGSAKWDSEQGVFHCRINNLISGRIYTLSISGENDVFNFNLPRFKRRKALHQIIRKLEKGGYTHFPDEIRGFAKLSQVEKSLHKEKSPLKKWFSKLF